MIEVVQVRESPYGFKFAEIAGPCNHPSWWTFTDEQIVRDRHWHIKPGEVVLDVGAAFGSYALPALAMGARVIAFNPADFDAELLQFNLDLNPELAARCLVVRDGLHERSGWFDPDNSTFHPDVGTDVNSSQLYGTIGHGPPGNRLRVRDLDGWLAERPGIDRVDWIKMDVEGAELGVLRGAEKCLRRWRPKLLIECHNFHVQTMEQDIANFVSGLGLGYRGEVHPHHSVSHAYLEAQ